MSIIHVDCIKIEIASWRRNICSIITHSRFIAPSGRNITPRWGYENKLLHYFYKYYAPTELKITDCFNAINVILI